MYGSVNNFQTDDQILVRDGKKGFWKKCLWPAVLVVLLGVGIGLGAIIGTLAHHSAITKENAKRCETLTTPMHINGSASYCEDKVFGNFTVSSGEVFVGLSVGTKCYLSCDDGHHLQGPNTLQCLKIGSWSNPRANCSKDASCPDLEVLQQGKLSCSDGSLVGSVCTFDCNSGFELKGAKTTTCFPNLTWSNRVPRCVPRFRPSPGPDSCPKCTCGPTCQFTNKFANALVELPSTPWGKGLVTYAGFDIYCDVNHHGGIDLHWDCTCVDLISHTEHKCYDYADEFVSCSHALANLINELARENVYPKPCDPDEMATYLKCT